MALDYTCPLCFAPAELVQTWRERAQQRVLIRCANNHWVAMNDEELERYTQL